MQNTHIVLRMPNPADEEFPGVGSFGVTRHFSSETEAEATIEFETLDANGRQEIARDPTVRAIAPDMPTRLIAPLADMGLADATTAWGIDAVGASNSALTGAGTRVAVLDTGVDAGHKAFAGVTFTQRDFSGDGDGDLNGHGTHCAGTIFGRDVEGTRIGVAPGVTDVLIGKVLGNDGGGSSKMIFDAIEWAAREEADVISMSLGFDFPGFVAWLVNNGWPLDVATSAALVGYRENLRMFDALMEVVQARAMLGNSSVVVAAAGNESRRNDNPNFEVSASLPAAAEDVISVAAAGQGRDGYRIAYFSNTDATITGPGVNILSAASGGGLKTLNGTSMACPHVAGVAALLWQEVRDDAAVPSDAETVRARLRVRARVDGFAPDTDLADRGAGMAFVGGSPGPAVADAETDAFEGQPV
ncbi:S8 family peptidase [Amaricoccus tamworthensis]|uniref:S8 family peptidase n=1 Tax=Amaricoccus tamworthensis TaxID=57002 RepID=UPI003C7A07A3